MNSLNTYFDEATRPATLDGLTVTEPATPTTTVAPTALPSLF